MMFFSALQSPCSTGEGKPLELVEMSANVFRMAYRAEIKRLQMRIFFDELQDISGQKSIKSLLCQLGVDVDDEDQVSAWYARARGQYIPRSSQTGLLRRKLAAAKFELHHPVWRWIATPDIDQRTVRRLKSQMPDYWHETSELLRTLTGSQMGASADLVDFLGLHRLSYLDALFLFWIERESARSRSNELRRVNLNRIIWLLPILYADDVIWAAAHRERCRLTLAMIDYSLGFRKADGPQISWGWPDRCTLLFDQHYWLEKHLRSHPQGLRTMLLRRRFLAKVWRWRNAV